MFVLATIKDTVKIEPQDWDKEPRPVLSQQIENKFANKVLPSVGLCIALHDYESIGDGYIYPSDGAAHYKVKFRMLVFRPFVGEVLTGKIRTTSEEGLKISLEFFDDIWVPAHLIFQPASFEPVSGMWTWTYEDDEDTGAEPHKFEMYPGDPVRVRVKTLAFTEVTLTAAGERMATTTSHGRAGAAGGGRAAGQTVAGGSAGVGNGGRTSNGQGGRGQGGGGDTERPGPVRERGRSFDLTTEQEAPAPLLITASMNDEGLGVPSWWTE